MLPAAALLYLLSRRLSQRRMRAPDEPAPPITADAPLERV
jgi:hypothetical protein